MTQTSRRWLITFSFVALVILAAVYFYMQRVVYVPGDLPQQAYVTTASPKILASASDTINELLIPAADISVASDALQVTPRSIDFAFWAKQGHPIGLVLNITLSPMHSGVFADASPATHLISTTAQTILQAAQKATVQIAELQIICIGCPQYPIGFETWINALSSSAGPSIPVTFSCPPQWLSDSNFSAAAKSSKGFVVQISPGRTSADIQQDVHAAAKWKLPFRPVIATANADPAAMAQLIQSWRQKHPENMTAILWSSLAADDQPDWHWATLHSVMDGIVPQPKVELTTRRLEPRLFEIDLLNIGDGDSNSADDVQVTWSDTDLDEAQALGGYQREETGRYSQTLHAGNSVQEKPLRPGEQRAIGWVRLADDAPVQAQFAPAKPNVAGQSTK